MAGYTAIAAPGYGAYILMKLPRAGLIQSDGPNNRDQVVNLPTAEWVPIGQLTGEPDIDRSRAKHDVSGADDEWRRYALGRKDCVVTFQMYYNPELATQSLDKDSALAQKCSLDYAFENDEVRTFRVLTKRPTYRGYGSHDFQAFIERYRITMPIDRAMMAYIQLQVTGPVTHERVSELHLVPGLDGKDLTVGE